jgi:hypothetical protein
MFIEKSKEHEAMEQDFVQMDAGEENVVKVEV